jgi:hypothetical protein
VLVLGLGGVARDHLKGLTQRVVTSGRLLVPLLLRGGIGGSWLSARCGWCSRDIGFCADGRYASVDFSKSGVRNGRVRNSF